MKVIEVVRGGDEGDRSGKGEVMKVIEVVRGR